MLSFIRMPFAAISLLLSTTYPPVGFAEKANKDSFSSGVSSDKKNTNTFLGKYVSWQLDKQGISIDLFTYAIKGYEYLDKLNRIANRNFITIIDFSKPSSEKRLFVINTETGDVLFKTLVAHGRNSGKEWASRFSNATSSFASSLGFYTTAGIYNGKHGISLRLNGCEKGFNDNAYKRAVVMHGAEYVSSNFIEQNGFLGRSHGCPAIPTTVSKKIIDVIKDGSCLFIYAPSKKYLSLSPIINS
jgi:hypothetical protein